MLATYLTRVQRLLQNPGAPTSLYSTADLTDYINQARGQVAGEGECVRTGGVVTTTSSQQGYVFSSIVIAGGPTITGISGVIHVRAIRVSIGAGFQQLRPNAWEWFDTFMLSNVVPPTGIPTDWAQFAQGASTIPVTGNVATGSFFVFPTPDAAYTLICDCVCYPQALTTDTDSEAIPYLWTDAVAYYAAYLALMGSQVSTRVADAQRMMQLFELHMNRARRFANPSLGRFLYEQDNDPAQQSAYGQGQAGGQS